MIVLVPISRFRIAFATAQGRPYSRLELLSCAAVADGAATLEALEETFRVPRRLVTQAVVTLVQDGFIALGGAGDQELLLTHQGERALGAGTLARRVITPARRAVVVMERLTGGLAPNAEIRFLDDRQVREQYRGAVRLPIRVGYNDLDGAQVSTLLPCRQYEWLHYVGSITQLSKGTQWLPVDADVEAGAVIGMPDRWDRRLATIILDEARRRVQDAEVVSTGMPPLPRQRRRFEPELSDSEALRLPPDRWTVAFDATHLVVDAVAAKHRLDEAFTSARTSLVVATPVISSEKVEAIADGITGACQRGVKVDILWGDDRDGGVDRLKKLRYDANLSACLDFNRQSAPTAMSAVVWDDGDAASSIIGFGFGAEAWTRADGIFAVEVLDAGLAAAVVRAAAGAWRATSGERLSSGPDRLARLAADLSALEQREGAVGGVEARIVLDRDHDIALLDALRQANRQLILVSRRPGAVAASRLVELLTRPREQSFELGLVIGGPADDSGVEHQVEGVLRAVEGTLTRRPGVGCGFVADDRVTVGSHDPLGSEAYETTRGMRHLSVELHGLEAANIVLDALAS